MKSCLIVTGGKLDFEFARSYLQKEHFDKIIAVDGGLEAVDTLGLMPDYIVGDFDTVKSTVTEKYHQFPFIVWDAHKPEKNETDTELARNRALALGCDRIVFLGATGGRIDHMLANLHLLFECMQKGADACIIDRQNRICLIDEKRFFDRREQWGTYISFLPYTEEVHGIVLKGFKYPLNNEDICRGYEAGRCISNEIAADSDTAEVTLADGILICIESRD